MVCFRGSGGKIRSANDRRLVVLFHRLPFFFRSRILNRQQNIVRFVHGRNHLWAVTKTACSVFWQSQSSSSFGNQRNICHQLKCFALILHSAKSNVCLFCLRFNGLSDFCERMFAMGRNCVVVAMLGLYGSVGLLEVLAQSTPGAGGGLPPMPIPADNSQTMQKSNSGVSFTLMAGFRLTTRLVVRPVTIPKPDGLDTTRPTQALEDVSEIAIRELSSIRAT